MGIVVICCVLQSPNKSSTKGAKTVELPLCLSYFFHVAYPCRMGKWRRALTSLTDERTWGRMRKAGWIGHQAKSSKKTPRDCNCRMVASMSEFYGSYLILHHSKRHCRSINPNSTAKVPLRFVRAVRLILRLRAGSQSLCCEQVSLGNPPTRADSRWSPPEGTRHEARN